MEPAALSVGGEEAPGVPCSCAAGWCMAGQLHVKQPLNACAPAKGDAARVL